MGFYTFRRKRAEAVAAKVAAAAPVHAPPTRGFYQLRVEALEPEHKLAQEKAKGARGVPGFESLVARADGLARDLAEAKAELEKFGPVKAPAPAPAEQPAPADKQPTNKPKR